MHHIMNSVTFHGSKSLQAKFFKGTEENFQANFSPQPSYWQPTQPISWGRNCNGDDCNGTSTQFTLGSECWRDRPGFGCASV